MKTYNIEIGGDGSRNWFNFVVLANDFSEALDKAGTFMENEQRKRVNKKVEFDIVEISLKDNIEEVKRISGNYVQPTFKS